MSLFDEGKIVIFDSGKNIIINMERKNGKNVKKYRNKLF